MNTKFIEERAKEILNYYIPNFADWNADDKCFYFFDNGYVKFGDLEPSVNTYDAVQKGVVNDTIAAEESNTFKDQSLENELSCIFQAVGNILNLQQKQYNTKVKVKGTGPV